jgi:hypothetical protein
LILRSKPQNGWTANGNRRTKLYVCTADIDAIKLHLARGVDDTISQGNHVSTQLAEKLTGIPAGTWRKWVNRQLCPIIGRKLSTKPQPVSRARKVGGSSPAIWILREDVEVVKAKWDELAALRKSGWRGRALPSPPQPESDVMTYLEAADACDVSKDVIGKWCTDGCAHLGGRRLTMSKRRSQRNRGNGLERLVRRDEIEAIKARLEAARSAGWRGRGPMPDSLPQSAPVETSTSGRAGVPELDANVGVKKTGSRGRPSGVSSRTKRLWDVEDELHKKLGRQPSTADVVKRFNRGLSDGSVKPRDVVNARYRRSAQGNEICESSSEAKS